MVVQTAGYEARARRLLGAMTADLLSRAQQDSGEHDRQAAHGCSRQHLKMHILKQMGWLCCRDCAEL